MTVREIQQQARQAYLMVLREHQMGWTPPPTEMRDKRWAMTLRETWPDCTTVYLTSKAVKHHDLMAWCETQNSGFWCNTSGEAWHFERRDIAALFKLTYGGNI